MRSRDITPEGARAPVGLLAELTYRCPLQCPYCSNPRAVERVADELPTGAWLDVVTPATERGVPQLIFPAASRPARRDLEDRRAAPKVGLWHGADLNVCAGTMSATIRPSTRCQRSFP